MKLSDCLKYEYDIIRTRIFAKALGAQKVTVVPLEESMFPVKTSIKIIVNY